MPQSGTNKMTVYQHQIAEAKEALARAEALFIGAGAGMGVDSGLPDFRGNQGFWNAYPIARKLGLSFVDLANPRWFEQDPALAWAFYGHRLQMYRTTKPHDGFLRLLRFAQNLKGGYFVFTSNVDGHFQKAGFDEQRIAECHGSIHYLQCTTPCTDAIWPADDVQVTIDMEQFRAQEPLPTCPYCGKVARPNILMFNDWQWIEHRTEEQERRMNAWLSEIYKNDYRLIVMEIGAGTAVPTVRRTCEKVAWDAEARFIRINPREYTVPSGQIGLACTAKEGLEMILPPSV